MKEYDVASQFHPDLFVPPHVLPLLMELFAGEKQQAFSLQEQLLPHLVACHYCRAAVVFLLEVTREYDRRNNNAEAQDLFIRFSDISNAIEAHEYEQMGAYAEAVVAQGRDKADLCFPDVAAHLRAYPDRRLLLEATISSITEPEETN